MLWDLGELGIKPVRKHIHDAGWDLFSIEDVDLRGMMEIASTIELKNCTYCFDIGVKVEIPIGQVGLIVDKGGRGDKLIKVFGGVIDAGYQDNIKIRLMNFGWEKFPVRYGMALAQIVIVSCDLSSAQYGEVGTIKSERGKHHHGSIDLSV